MFVTMSLESGFSQFQHSGHTKEPETVRRGEKEYAVDRPSDLKPSDFGKDDRVFISTESGNRYMIRWSKSGNTFKIYNERADDFNHGETLYNSYDGDTSIAETGKPLEFFIVTDPVRNLGRKMAATQVTGIEIRRNIDSAIENASTGTSFQGIAQGLIDNVHGRLPRE